VIQSALKRMRASGLLVSPLAAAATKEPAFFCSLIKKLERIGYSVDENQRVDVVRLKAVSSISLSRNAASYLVWLRSPGLGKHNVHRGAPTSRG
jgi:hypothetical protein